MAERKETEELDKLLQENCDEVIVEFKRPGNKGMPRFRVEIILSLFQKELRLKKLTCNTKYEMSLICMK